MCCFQRDFRCAASAWNPSNTALMCVPRVFTVEIAYSSNYCLSLAFKLRIIKTTNLYGESKALYCTACKPYDNLFLNSLVYV